MAKGGKNKKRNNRRPQNSNPPKAQVNAPAVNEPVKVDNAVNEMQSSKSLEEFEANKDRYINAFAEELAELEIERDTIKAECNNAQDQLEAKRLEIEALESEYSKINSVYSNIQKEVNEANTQLDQTNAELEQVKGAAEEEKKKILDAAMEERLQIIGEAREKASQAWREKIEELEKQLDTLAEQQSKIDKDRLQLKKDQQQFEIDREEMEDFQAYLKALEVRYNQANPQRINELEIELDDANKEKELIIAKYQEQGRQLHENQVFLDSIKAELHDKDGGVVQSSVGSVLKSLQDLRKQYEELKAVYSRYPDDISIEQLEEKAARVDRLLVEKNELEQERNSYREEASAARNASKELEVVKHEVEATNALNEHLLKELESHKTALESRTGDTCPALSKVDAEVEDVTFIRNINKRNTLTQLTSLAGIVEHVKNYAGSRPKRSEQLYYKDNDIRAFLAGMAVSRLIVLQGMSGTGKSSLPRIFSEAISGSNKLIPVESSWRDRNELLGYYNDFNKRFNAKTFTIELYRSGKERCCEVPTFIILDEMNLARVEYYFSDFLAVLQKPNHDDWVIELVSSDMRTLPMELPEDIKTMMSRENPSAYETWKRLELSRQGDLRSEVSDSDKDELFAFLAEQEQLTGAKDLIDGRKIKIEDNVWFVGTANQDESTFEITDKVYDRAQVVSLNEKAKKETYSKTDAKSISIDGLIELFNAAIDNNPYEIEVHQRLDKLDDCLIEHFDVSFGTRIVNQTTDFVAVFTAAGGSLEDALDYQISTKIVRKVINSDDEEALMSLLDATSDYRRTQRIVEKRLNEFR